MEKNSVKMPEYKSHKIVWALKIDKISRFTTYTKREPIMAPFFIYYF